MGLHIEIDGVPAYRLIEDGPNIKVEPAYGRAVAGSIFVTSRAVYRCISLFHDGQPRWARESPEYQWHRIAKAFVKWVESDLLPRRSRERKLREGLRQIAEPARTNWMPGEYPLVITRMMEIAKETLAEAEEEDDHPLAN